MTSESTPRPGHKRQWGWIILAVLALSGLIWISYKIIRAIELVQQLEYTSASLQKDIDNAGSVKDVNAVLSAMRSDAQMAADTVAEMQQTVWPFGGLLRTFKWIPIYGPDLAAVPPTLDLAEALLASARHLDVGLSPVVESFKGKGSGGIDTLRVVSQTISSHQADLEAARHELQAAYAARQQIGSISELHPQLRNAITKSDRALNALNQALTILEAMPDALGAEQPHHILLLLQNADELRPTGGFITYTIYLVIDKGQIVEQDAFPSSGPELDRISTLVYDLPPEPMHRYMDMPIWLFRDANWSPDFPTAATKAAQLYVMGRQVPVDTVVALDQYAIQALLKDIGPIILNDGTVISDENIIQRLHDLWGQYRLESGLSARKDFIPDLAPIMLDRALHVTDTNALLSRLRAIQQGASRGDLLVYSTRPTVQGLAEIAGLDGAVSDWKGDYLYVVDSNIGVDKTDLNVDRTLSYHVSLADPTQPYSILQLSYTNKSPGQHGSACPVMKEPVTQYVQEADDCYVDYLRLYLTEDTRVVQSPTFTLPGNFVYAAGPTNVGEFRHLLSERNKEVYGVLMIVNPGGTLHPSFVYQLSPKNIFALQPDGTIAYDLLVKRQPGVRGRASTINIDLPSGSQLVDTTPEPVSKSQQVIAFESQLDSGSLQIHLVLRLSPDMQKQLATIIPSAQTQPLLTPTPRLAPTDVPPSTPIPTGTSTLAAEPKTSVRDRTVLRKGPGTVFSAITTISSGELVTVLGRDEPGLWVFVTRTSTGETGWVIAKLVSGLPSVSAIPLQPNIPDPSSVNFNLPPGRAQQCQLFNWKPAALFRFSSQANSLKLFDLANASSIENQPAFQLIRTGLPSFLLISTQGDAIPNSCQSSEKVCARVALTLCAVATAGAPLGSYRETVGLSIGIQQHDQLQAESQIDIPVTFQVALPSLTATSTPLP